MNDTAPCTNASTPGAPASPSAYSESTLAVASGQVLSDHERKWIDRIAPTRICAISIKPRS